jgi:hypothetical protein
MKNIERGFVMMADRYRYDLGKCSIDKGWAQIDTSQDASYFGQWINPIERKIFAYIEGDTVLTQVDSDEELAGEIAEMKRWNEQQVHEFLGIDPGFNEPLKTALVSAGLGGYLH